MALWYAFSAWCSLVAFVTRFFTARPHWSQCRPLIATGCLSVWLSRSDVLSRRMNASKWCRPKRFPSHLNNVSTLSCETWNAHSHMLPLSCYRKKLQNLSHLNCGLQVRQIWIQLIAVCGKCCKRRCEKHASLLWSYQQRYWRMATAMTTYPSFRPNWPTPFSVAVSVHADQWHVFCTPSLAIVLKHYNQLDSNLENFEATVDVG